MPYHQSFECIVFCAEIEADEKLASTVTWDKNGNLGRFTNFVNLMDMAAIAVPSGILRCKPAPSGSTGQSPLYEALCIEAYLLHDM